MPVCAEGHVAHQLCRWRRTHLPTTLASQTWGQTCSPSARSALAFALSAAAVRALQPEALSQRNCRASTAPRRWSTSPRMRASARWRSAQPRPPAPRRAAPRPCTARRRCPHPGAAATRWTYGRMPPRRRRPTLPPSTPSWAACLIRCALARAQQDSKGWQPMVGTLQRVFLCAGVRPGGPCGCAGADGADRPRDGRAADAQHHRQPGLPARAVGAPARAAPRAASARATPALMAVASGPGRSAWCARSAAVGHAFGTRNVTAAHAQRPCWGRHQQGSRAQHQSPMQGGSSWP